MRIPEPCFDHLHRLSDSAGVLEHAWYAIPRRSCGYTTDDVARALIVVCREPSPPRSLVELAGVYLSFLLHAHEDGRYHNRLTFDRKWADSPVSGDCHGRAIWALGIAARHGPTQWVTDSARFLFEQSARLDTAYPRPHAYAALGYAEMLAAEPSNSRLRELLEHTAQVLPRPANDQFWPWPEARLTYDNARLPQALLCAGETLKDSVLVADGLRLLEWLVHIETHRNHFSFAPVGGWDLSEPRPGFDQQPLEAAAMADACLTAWRVTTDDRWLDYVQNAAQWFLGANDIGTALYDFETGGCRDGLSAHGANQNQGAESTLAALTAFAQARTAAEYQTAAAPTNASRSSASPIVPAPTARSAAP
ncbi:MAG: glycosyltransferase [Gammaproteobacteria bacterium]